MPKYTTGEIANLAGVSVRTVQFYDTKDLLHPSEISDGGRRLYTDKDLEKLNLICALKSIGLALDAIKGILESKNPGKVLSILLDEQAKELNDQMNQMDEQMQRIKTIRDLIEDQDKKDGLIKFGANNIAGIKDIMDGRKQMRKVYTIIFAVGIPLDILEIVTLALWIAYGLWWPFLASIGAVIIGSAFIIKFFYAKAAYICPDCGAKFKPSTKEFLFSKNTSKTRVLTCSQCGETNWCIEVYSGEVK